MYPVATVFFLPDIAGDIIKMKSSHPATDAIGDGARGADSADAPFHPKKSDVVDAALPLARIREKYYEYNGARREVFVYIRETTTGISSAALISSGVIREDDCVIRSTLLSYYAR